MGEVRQLGLEDFDARVALSEFAFQFAYGPERQEREKTHFRPEQHFGIFDDEDGRLLSAYVLHPFEAWVGGRKLAMGGIAGVASWPDARRQGGVRKLLRHALETMRARGQSLSMLAPFQFAFYRRFGYEMTIERKRYTLETRHLPPRVETPGRVRMAEKSAERLQPMYAAFASRYAGTLARDASWWERRVLGKPGQSAVAAVYTDAEGLDQGYVLYEVKDRTMTVYEWVALTAEADDALWTFAANHDSMIDKLTVTMPMDDDLSFRVPDPRFRQEIEPYFMSRIVDAEAFVRQYAFERGEADDVLTVAVRDEHAAWHDGTFRLRITADGQGSLERLGAGGAGADAELDIASLTALLLGGRRPAALRRMGRLRGTDGAVAALERRVPRQLPYLADFF